MRRILVAATALLLALVTAGCSSTAAIGEKLDPAAFLAQAAEPGVVVIDVRSPQEYAEGHLEGALNINVEAPDFDAQIAVLDPGATYALYCRSGRRSAVAAQRMAEAGFGSVLDLEGGMADLAAAGAPVAASP